MKPRLLTLLPVLALLTTACAEDKPAKKEPAMKPEVQLSDEEWQKRLTPEQYAVTRKAGTERAFGAVYEEFERQGAGTYYCICCGAELFNSDTKFHSGCGWPSFYDQSNANNVLERKDMSHGMVRIETVCKRCGAHLGHVFEGETVSANTPTNRRFCINGVALNYVPKGQPAPKLLAVGSAEVEKKKEEVAEKDAVKKP
ncbi:MAG TPA: peptide-methionine (R)-S-oxide reductase MsrB [Prosthecobacter sp.]|nr:peptide-methionine (R)-S-oxide reductase MsrB [Prosthecobacter sp.]